MCLINKNITHLMHTVSVFTEKSILCNLQNMKHKKILTATKSFLELRGERVHKTSA